MVKLSLSLSITIILILCDSPQSMAVFGGHEIAPDRVPYQVNCEGCKVANGPRTEYWGGILIRADLVLTHGTQGSKSSNISCYVGYLIRSQRPNEKILVEKIILPPEDLPHHEVVILWLKFAFNFGQRVQIAPLAIEDDEEAFPKDGILFGSGFGRNQPPNCITNKLRIVRLPVVDDPKAYPVEETTFWLGYTGSMKKASMDKLAYGDHGGPVFTDLGTVVGMTYIDKEQYDNPQWEGQINPQKIIKLSKYRKWIDFVRITYEHKNEKTS